MSKNKSHIDFIHAVIIWKAGTEQGVTVTLSCFKPGMFMPRALTFGVRLHLLIWTSLVWVKLCYKKHCPRFLKKSPLERRCLTQDCQSSLYPALRIAEGRPLLQRGISANNSAAWAALAKATRDNWRSPWVFKIPLSSSPAILSHSACVAL